MPFYMPFNASNDWNRMPKWEKRGIFAVSHSNSRQTSNLTFQRARDRDREYQEVSLYTHTHSESAPVLISLRNEILSPWRERSMIYQRADISSNRLTSFRQAAFLEQKGGHRSRFHGVSPDRWPRLISFDCSAI